MSRILLFNKPYGVIGQSNRDVPHPALADYIPVPVVYPAGYTAPAAVLYHAVLNNKSAKTGAKGTCPTSPDYFPYNSPHEQIAPRRSARARSGAPRA